LLDFFIIIGDFAKKQVLKSAFLIEVCYLCSHNESQNKTKTMKRISLILVVAMVALAAQSQLLWKVSGNGLGRPSYIMGTHHMAPASMIDKIPGMDKAIEGCDIVVGELDNASMTPTPELQEKLNQAMIAPPDSTLDKLFSKEDYAIVESVFNKYFGGMGVKLKTMKNLKPIALSTQMEAMQAIKYFPNLVNSTDLIDMAVQKRANDACRPSMALETVEDQINLLFNTPLTEQAAALLALCKDDEYFQVSSSALVEAYMSQDLDRIHAVMTDVNNGGDNEEDMERLVYSRNRDWFDKLKGIMPERACLVCVGAGHLPGPKGLLQLMRDAGYKVEPMQ